MRKALAVLAVLALIAAGAYAELSFERVSVTNVSQTIDINAGTLTVVNDGSNEVYVRVFWEGETTAASTSAKAEIKSGEVFTFSKTLSVKAISLICAGSETATVRLYYW